MSGECRFLISLGFVLFLSGCDSLSSNSVPVYNPKTFRADIKSLIEKECYEDAVRFVVSADPVAQAHHDGHGYLAVAEDLIVLPGVDSEMIFDRDRDWEIPGTSDAMLNKEWQQAATEFARRYNRARQASGSL